MLVRNAGLMLLGPGEAFSPGELTGQYDVNVLETQRVNRTVLPHLRAQGSGHLVWISSASARGGGPPFAGPYLAAKAAMDSLAVSYAGDHLGKEEARRELLNTARSACAHASTSNDRPSFI